MKFLLHLFCLWLRLVSQVENTLLKANCLSLMSSGVLIHKKPPTLKVGTYVICRGLPCVLFKSNGMFGLTSTDTMSGLMFGDIRNRRESLELKDFFISYKLDGWFYKIISGQSIAHRNSPSKTNVELFQRMIEAAGRVVPSSTLLESKFIENPKWGLLLLIQKYNLD